MAGELNDSNCVDPVEVCLVWNDDLNCFVLTTNFGNEKPVKTPPMKVTGELVRIGDDCLLNLFVNNVRCDQVNLTDMLSKVTNELTGGFNADNCTISLNLNGNPVNIDLSEILMQLRLEYLSDVHGIRLNRKGQNGVIHEFNVGALGLNVNDDGTCSLRYTNERNQTNFVPLPQTSYSFNEITCVLTITDSKSGQLLSLPVGTPADDLCIKLDDNLDLVLTAKDQKVCTVVLPNFVTSVNIDNTNCTMKVSYWTGTVDTLDYLAPINLDKSADGSGGFAMTLKGQTCVFNPPSLTPDPNNPFQFLWDNGYGQTQVVNINEIDMDINNVSLTGSTLTFTTEDGTSAAYDICAIVAANCNATFVMDGFGNVTFVDNAGQSDTFYGPKPTSTDSSVSITPQPGAGPNGELFWDFSVTKCEVVAGDNVTVTQTTAPNGNIIYTVSAADAPSGAVSTITDNENNTFTHSDGNGNAVDVFMGSVAAQPDGTIRLTDNAGNECDAAALRLDTTDNCYHYLVDTKTNQVVSSWCVEDVEQSFNEDYNFTSEFVADLNAAGIAGNGSNISLAGMDLIPSAPDGYMTFGPYQLVVTNPSACADMSCNLNARLGSLRFEGAAGGLTVSMVGTGGTNSPTANLDVGKSANADPLERTCRVSDNTPSSSTSYCMGPGSSRTHSILIRLRKFDTFIPTEETAQVGAGAIVAQIDTVRMTVACTSKKSNVG